MCACTCMRIVSLPVTMKKMDKIINRAKMRYFVITDNGTVQGVSLLMHISSDLSKNTKQNL